MHSERMRRFLASLLVLSLLLGGAAWAADDCGEALFGVPVHLLDGDSPQGPSKQPPADFCGHCAHAQAHLTAMLPPQADGLLLPPTGLRPRVSALHLSLSEQPPTQPPKA